MIETIEKRSIGTAWLPEGKSYRFETYGTWSGLILLQVLIEGDWRTEKAFISHRDNNISYTFEPNDKARGYRLIIKDLTSGTIRASCIEIEERAIDKQEWSYSD